MIERENVPIEPDGQSQMQGYVENGSSFGKGRPSIYAADTNAADRHTNTFILLHQLTSLYDGISV